jgi:hypothetical protein
MMLIGLLYRDDANRIIIHMQHLMIENKKGQYIKLFKLINFILLVESGILTDV